MTLDGRILCAAVALVAAVECGYAQKHFLFVNRDRARLTDERLLQNGAFTGFQVKYVWRELEPSKGNYDFRAIRQDFARLASRGKRLFIQVQDVTFSADFKNVPRYLQTEPEFGGGVAMQFTFQDGKRVPDGWVARRWDPAVRARFHLLLTALGAEFDGKIEGINLAETAIGIREGDQAPAGFSAEAYRDAVISNMAALKKAFPKSTAMQYANFMPGEWLPESDKGHLRSVYAAARRLHVAVGGPDLLPYRQGQLDHAYPLIAESAGVVPTGIAVQEGNYAHTDPSTKQRVSAETLLKFARDVLHVDYMFWCMQEPFFSRDVVPHLAELYRNGSATRR